MWRIEAGRLGPVEVGSSLPAELLDGDLAMHYLARYIADAQPVDAFAYESPPLLIILASGPFRTQVEKTGKVSKPDSDALRAKAADDARRGAKVKTIMVRGEGPVTDAGVGVGSKLVELKTAYADLQLSALPETLGNDTCRAHSKTLPGVQFMFATCSQAKDGASVVRVDIVNPAG